MMDANAHGCDGQIEDGYCDMCGLAAAATAPAPTG